MCVQNDIVANRREEEMTEAIGATVLGIAWLFFGINGVILGFRAHRTMGILLIIFFPVAWIVVFVEVLGFNLPNWIVEKVRRWH